MYQRHGEPYSVIAAFGRLADMKIQIARISIGQTAKVVGVIHVVLGLPILLLGIVAMLTRPTWVTSAVSPVWLFLAPFVYGLGAFILAMLMCLIYNIVARYVGGVEYTTSETTVG
jgi:hypothetical protein